MTDAPLVLITGVSGYIASWVAHTALKAGYRVRGTVRSLSNEKKVQHLRDLCPSSRYQIELVEADLTADRGWDAAAAGCAYVLHVASPFPLAEPKSEDELVRPAVEGTLRVLRAAAGASVRRVVVTSSSTAVVGGQSKRGFSDEDWSDLSNQKLPLGAYPKSKTLAEKAAWDFVQGLPEGGKMEMAAVCPTFVLGPMLSAAQCSSAELFRQLVMGELPGLPEINFNFVSVLDVARAHLLAMTLPQAAGRRFLCSSGQIGLREMAAIVKTELRPHGYSVTSMHVPAFVLHALAFFGDRIAATALPMLGLKLQLHCRNAREILGLELKEDKDLIRQMLYAAIHAGIVPDKSKGQRLTKEYRRPDYDTSMIPSAL